MQNVESAGLLYKIKEKFVLLMLIFPVLYVPKAISFFELPRDSKIFKSSNLQIL